jgi:cell division protein FtsQ
MSKGLQKRPLARGGVRERDKSLHNVVRQSNSAHRQRRWLRTALVLSIVVVGGASSAMLAGNWLLQRFLYENPKYALTHIEVEESGRLRRDRILEWAQIPQDCNLLALDLGIVRGRLEDQPQVASVEVRRELPNRLIIRVQERRPLARVVCESPLRSLGSTMFLLDREGFVIRPQAGETAEYLPEIRGVQLTDVVPGRRLEVPEVICALHLLQLVEMSQFKEDVEIVSVDVAQSGRLMAGLPMGAKVWFSNDSQVLPQQLDRLRKISGYCTENNRKLGSADLTVIRNVPVTFAASEG